MFDLIHKKQNLCLHLLLTNMAYDLVLTFQFISRKNLKLWVDNNQTPQSIKPLKLIQNTMHDQAVPSWWQDQTWLK